MQKDHHSIHIPVMLAEVLAYLAPVRGETLLDVTAGYGGHAHSILEKTSQDRGSVLLDRDQKAVAELRKRFEGRAVEVINSDFASATKKFYDNGQQFDLILADLGVSSPHLDNPDRGFSFQHDGPLDMRMDSSSGLTAAKLVNTETAEALENILRNYGEEPRARKIVQAIIAARPLSTTQALAEVVARSLGGRGRYKTHPATKTFQALRIAVNKELDQLKAALPLWLAMLRPGGRLAVISFHSLEDRIVKEALKEASGNRYDSTVALLTKKPVVATPSEVNLNPRARSAKLRVAVKK